MQEQILDWIEAILLDNPHQISIAIELASPKFEGWPKFELAGLYCPRQQVA